MCSRCGSSELLLPISLSSHLSSSAGHESPRFGHEFIEFEVNNRGDLRYANNSNYRKSELIKRDSKFLLCQHLLMTFCV